MFLTVDNISYSVDGEQVLKDVSMHVDRGQVVGLLGPSGSGKTTLLKHIIGILPSYGKITIDDRPVPFDEMYSFSSYMLQADALYEDISGYDNMLFFARLYNIANVEAEIWKALRICDLVDDAPKLVKNYSGGMKRRLSFATTLINDPSLMVLDEPTIGIDPLLREKFWLYFAEMKRSNASVVITTHIMSDAERCDYIFFLSDGVIAAHGTPESIKKQTNSNTIDDAYLVVVQMLRDRVK